MDRSTNGASAAESLLTCPARFFYEQEYTTGESPAAARGKRLESVLTSTILGAPVELANDEERMLVALLRSTGILATFTAPGVKVFFGREYEIECDGTPISGKPDITVQFEDGGVSFFDFKTWRRPKPLQPNTLSRRMQLQVYHMIGMKRFDTFHGVFVLHFNADGASPLEVISVPQRSNLQAEIPRMFSHAWRIARAYAPKDKRKLAPRVMLPGVCWGEFGPCQFVHMCWNGG